MACFSGLIGPVNLVLHKSALVKVNASDPPLLLKVKSLVGLFLISLAVRLMLIFLSGDITLPEGSKDSINFVRFANELENASSDSLLKTSFTTSYLWSVLLSFWFISIGSSSFQAAMLFTAILSSLAVVVFYRLFVVYFMKRESIVLGATLAFNPFGVLFGVVPLREAAITLAIGGVLSFSLAFFTKRSGRGKIAVSFGVSALLLIMLHSGFVVFVISVCLLLILGPVNSRHRLKVAGVVWLGLMGLGFATSSGLGSSKLYFLFTDLGVLESLAGRLQEIFVLEERRILTIYQGIAFTQGADVILNFPVLVIGFFLSPFFSPADLRWLDVLRYPLCLSYLCSILLLAISCKPPKLISKVLYCVLIGLIPFIFFSTEDQVAWRHLHKFWPVLTFFVFITLQKLVCNKKYREIVR